MEAFEENVHRSGISLCFLLETITEFDNFLYYLLTRRIMNHFVHVHVRSIDKIPGKSGLYEMIPDTVYLDRAKSAISTAF